MKKILALTLVLAMTLSLAGCTKDSTNRRTTDLMENISTHDLDVQPDRVTGAQAVTDFSVHLAQSSFRDGENLLLSPLSVLCALAMTANGAKEQTLEQMEDVLGMPIDEMNKYLFWYLSSLPQGEKYRLYPANSIWFTADSRFTPKQDFLQTTADYYDADIYCAPFDDSTCKDINNWVKKRTDGMIEEILHEMMPDAVMYLINALSFEAQWSSMYEEYAVREGIFTKEDGSEQNAEMMYATEYQYLADDLATGFIKRYEGRSYAFAALLPREGLSIKEYLQSLTGEQLRFLLDNVQSTPVKTAIPKFETQYSAELSDVLSHMGVTDAFRPDRADFSALGTSTAGNIFISQVLHKTFLSVTEQGTRAGAVTVVEPTDGASIEPDKAQEVILDRPFVYLLIDCENGVPFFIGVMMDLEQ